MLMPSIFGEDLFDNFMKDFPFFDDNTESNVEKKLYGRRGKNLMKTDIKETEGGWKWICLDLQKMRSRYPWRMVI